MKTTLEIPDAIFRKAKARAAERGIPLRQLVTEAVEKDLAVADPTPDKKPWMKMFGGLKHLHAESVRIQEIIDEEFGQLEPEDLL
ncbi:MAG: hypothetical protein ABI824_03980 [Acidobacteriota bacterium]